LRKEIFGQELAAERIEQMMLEAAVPRTPDAGRAAGQRVSDGAQSLKAYLQASGVAPDPQDTQHLATLLGAALGDSDGARAAIAKVFG
jgi:hypothetical protein